MEQFDLFIWAEVRGLQFPIVPTIEREEHDSHIIPIEFDEWKRKDLKFIERTYSRKYFVKR